MKGVIQTERIPIKLWAPVEEIEDEAISQLKKTAAVPGVVGLAVMPDVHLGHGATIGSVIATRGMVIPSAVGVDIGCGMMAAKLPFSVHRLSHGNIKYLREEIELRIPVGFTDHKIASVEALLWMGGEHPCGFTHLHAAIQKDASRAARQLGTLGGGNHFVEVCVDEAEQVWLLLHSGSRGVGNKLAQIHIEVAKDLMRRYFIALPDPELAYLVQQTPEFNAYWRDLQWAQAYAMKNRELMMEAVMRAVAWMPGRTEFTVTPSPATSRASVLRNPVAPARAVLDRISPAIGWRTATEVMATTRPQCWACMAGTAALHMRNVPRTITAIVVSQCWTVRSASAVYFVSR